MTRIVSYVVQGLSVRLGLVSFAALFLLTACSGGPRPVSSPAGLFGKDQSGFGLMNTSYLLGPGDTVRLTFFLEASIQKEEYRLQPGDVLLLEIHRHEQLNRNLVVRPDGRVTIPFVGDIMAAGRTNRELAAEITVGLQKVYTSPEVTVSVIRFNSYYRQIQEALSNTSGTRQQIDLAVELDGTMHPPLCPRLQVAGRSTDSVEAEIRSYYSKLGGNMGVTVQLMEAKSYLAYVLGEVNRPGIVEMRSPMTVTQILSAAGGYRDTAGLSSVVLVRPNNEFKPVARLLNISNVLSKGDLREDEIVQRFDIIYVPPSLIAELNQVVLMGIRNMLPVQTSAGFSYIWGNQKYFQPF